MGVLKKGLATKHAKLKIIPLGSVAMAISSPTGFDLIDYNTATICENADGEEFLNPGIPFGKIVLFCGNSQGGKTTLAIQIAHNMIGDLNGDIIILDYERSSNNLPLRYRQITGCTKEEFEENVTVYNHVEMSTEFFKQIIFEIAEMKKKELKKADMVDWYDVNGNPIKIYPPTVVIVDAIPSVKPEEVLTDASLDNNMIPGKMAAANSNALKSIIALLETYNITIFGLNHITTKINTNKYAPRTIQIPGLGESENLPGGNGWVYMPSYIFKLSSGAELKIDKDFVEGRYTEVRILKTRSGFNNRRLKFVLAAKNGFSNPHTLLEFAKEQKILKGGGRGGYTISSHDASFSLKAFYKLYSTDESFKEAFDGEISDYLAAQVNERYADINDESDPTETDLDEEFDD